MGYNERACDHAQQQRRAGVNAKVRFVLTALLFVTLLGWASTAQAQTKSLYWKRMDVDIQVQPNGDMRIIETHDIVFSGGPFHFGVATIPPGRWEAITDVRVSDETQRAYTNSRSEREYTFYTERDDQGNFVVNWFFPYTSDAEHIYRLEYTVHGGLRYYPDNNQVYWKAIPPDHDFAIQASTVTVHLPPGATVLRSKTDPSQIMARVSAGVPAAVNVSADGNVVVFTAERPLRPGEEMEVFVPFPAGFVTGSAPSWQAAVDRQEAWNSTGRPLADLGLGVLGVLLLILGPGAVFLLWYTRGRDPQVALAATYIASPPSDLRPGLAGTLIDEQADMQDIMATLIDLARRGYLTIAEEQKPGLFGIGSSRDFVYTRTDKPLDDLLPYERTLMDRLFGARHEQRLSDLRNKFYTAVPMIQSQLYQEVVRAGFFRSNPDTTRKLYTGLGIALLVVVGGLGVVLTGALASSFSSAIVCPFISLGIAAFGLIVAGHYMPARTRTGAEEAAKWRAFKTYLQNVTKYANVKEAADQFDKYLPYAIAFGVDRSWINTFSQVETVPIPVWYRPWFYGGVPMRGGETVTTAGGPLRPLAGSGEGFSLDRMSQGMAASLSSMSEGLSSMLNTAGSVLTSSPAPQSTGRGGWSGGGFSGGGGGGGGGGRGFG